jgi:pimeloyl-ACP methyl ester carboxylesterase
MAPTTMAGADGLRLAVDVFPGHRATGVLLLHGGGQTRHAWRATAARLSAAGWHSIAVDLRGHGDSDWSTPRDYSLDAFRRDVAALVRSRPAPPVVVGASLGGLAALLALAEPEPVQVAGLVLVDIAHRFDGGGARRVLAFMSARPGGFDDPGQAAAATARYLPHRARTADPDGIVKNLRRRDGRWHWHWDPALLEAAGLLVEPDAARRTEQRLARVVAAADVPMLLVRGAHSDVLPADIAAEFAELARDARVVAVDDAGHMVAGDSNDRFGAAVLEFLGERFHEDGDESGVPPRPSPDLAR